MTLVTFDRWHMRNLLTIPLARFITRTRRVAFMKVRDRLRFWWRPHCLLRKLGRRLLSHSRKNSILLLRLTNMVVFRVLLLRRIPRRNRQVTPGMNMMTRRKTLALLRMVASRRRASSPQRTRRTTPIVV